MKYSLHVSFLSLLLLPCLVFGITAPATYPSVQITSKGKDSNPNKARRKASAKFKENCQQVCHDNGCTMVTSSAGGTNPSRANHFCGRKGSTTTLGGTCYCQCTNGTTSLNVASEFGHDSCSSIVSISPIAIEDISMLAE